jgi:hypothetical protein
MRRPTRFNSLPALVQILCISLLVLAVPAPGRAGPLRVGGNGHYFIDGATGQPFFWLGTTQWAIFRGYTLDEARLTVDKFRGNGYTVLATMLAGGTVATVPNLEGQTIWLNNDPSTPNEAYFKRVDAIVSYAASQGMMVRIGMLHNSQLQYMGNGRGRAYAKFVAARYKDIPNILWSLHGNVDNPALIAMVREMVEGIREGDGGTHLISQKPDPSPRSSGIIQNEPWLGFTQSQTFKRVDLIRSMVTTDYNRTPPKPTVMDEGAYESGTEYGFPVTPLIVRRQAYYTYLSGGFHTYGHNDSWRILPGWKAALDAPGAAQVGKTRGIFESLAEWWLLTPDQEVLASGGNTDGDVLHLGARHKDGKWAMVYCAAPNTFAVAMEKLSGKAKAYWIDPRTGEAKPAGSHANRGPWQFTTPAGWEDAVLVLATGSGLKTRGKVGGAR